MKTIMKIVMWILIVFGTGVVGLLGYYFISVSGQVMEVTWDEVIIEKMEEMEVEDGDDIQDFGLNAEQVRDFEENPEKYRYIIFVMEFINRSNMAGVVDIKFKSQLPEELQKRLVWIQNEPLANYLPPSESRGDGVSAIIRLEEGDTEQEILDMAKKARITITGQKVGLLKRHGSYSITVTFSRN